ncbi:MAG: hypothetical protein BV459_04985 [Thermoplasmata archaeon M11B2D]|nr:MAG: hypothetical protein BV459_04985 [Thermoplasmata archaeon M11B2D]
MEKSKDKQQPLTWKVVTAINSFFLLFFVAVVGSGAWPFSKPEQSTNIIVVLSNIPSPQDNYLGDYDFDTPPEKYDQQEFDRLSFFLVSEYRVSPKRAIPITKTILIASKKYNIPSYILAGLIATESSYIPEQKSKSNAIGYAQVKPVFWKRVCPYDISHPEENILAGAWILNRYREKTGSLDSAIMAYNIGITDFNRNKNMDAASRYFHKVKIRSEQFRTVLSSNTNENQYHF